jgi:diguanylate cyclase (GGDEF)-like protein/PAS domain S-box-containing protein
MDHLMPAVTGPEQRAASGDTRDRTRVRWFAVASALWAVVFVVLPVGIHAAWFMVFGWTAIAVVLLRSLRLPAGLRRPTVMISLAGASSLTSGVVREVHAGLAGANYPFPSPADALIFLSYGLFVGAILDVVRKRVARPGPDPVLDAAVAGIAAALLQWSLIVVPYLQRQDVSQAAKNTNILYSVMSVALVAAAVLALVVGSRPTASSRLLAGGLIVTFAADPIATLVTSGTLPASVLILTLATAIALGGAGVLHPSVRFLTAEADDPDVGRRLTRRRITVLAMALLTAPVLLLRAAWFGETGVELLLPALASLALTPVVVTRFGRLVRQNEQLATLEQTLRGVGERLVGAETADDVSRIITVGVEQVLGERLLEGAMITDPLRRDDERMPLELRPALRALATDAAFGDRLVTGRIEEVALPEDSRVWQVGPILVQNGLRGALVVATSDGLSPAEGTAFVALCREGAIALRAVEQTQDSVRRRSEERFGALVTNSADILAVLDEDLLLLYVSPVAERLLGHDVSDPESLEVIRLVHPQDHEVAVALIDDVRRGAHRPVELRLRHADGSYHWFEVMGVDMSENADIGGITLNAREIGDRKAAEQRLLHSEARFKALVQHSSDLVLVVDPGKGVSYASPSAAQIIGLPADALLSSSPGELFVDSGVNWASLLGDGHRAGTRSDLEFGFRNRSDDWVYLAATISDLRDEPWVGGFVINARDVTERTGMLQRLRHQATHDELTGLPNRVLAGEELAGMLRRNGGASTVAVVSVDLDDFKDVNDSLGHALGDELLKAVAERITTRLNFGDLAARVGGDEFVVVLERARGEDRVLEIAEGLLESLSRPFLVEGRELHVAASAGLAFDHDRSSPAEVLLRDADTAMYRAKQAGKRQCVVFEPEMRTASFDRLELRADLARAIDTEQFRAFYQPVVDLATGRITGAEALVRWEHPTRGMLSPAIFVPLAEETGLIVELGEWMLRQACSDLAQWRQDLPGVASDLSIAVNLSAQELHGERLVPAVLDTLATTRLPADRLVLEVTESNLLADTEVVAERMRRLRELGAKLAIDDFGTGYSSLGYIQRYDFDILKIDRSFVEALERPTNRRIVTAVLDLARELDVRTVAEGIETEAQRDTITAMGCDRGQGYLWSRPVPASEFLTLLQAARALVADPR